MSALLCTWSHAADAETRIIFLEGAVRGAKAKEWAVCPQHEPLLQAYLNRAKRQQSRFFTALFISMGSALAPLFTTSSFGIAAPLMLLGATLVAFPFATPLTVAKNGVAGSIKVLRLLGTILLLLGAVFVGLVLLGA